MQISTTPTDRPVDDARLAEILANPGFGLHFTDHMFTVEWTPDEGWHDARITPYGPLTLDPATAVLHYAQEIFEGMKAYRHEDGSVWTFRPEENAERMVRSATGSRCPSCRSTTSSPGRRAGRRSTSAGCPSAAGEKSLYVRPFMIASEVFLGVRPAQHVTFMVIASPAGAYFTRAAQAGHALAHRGLHPRRPRRHGRGQDRRQLRQLAGRPAGGHRARLRPGRLPRRAEGQYVEELGGMNMYFVYADGRSSRPRAPARSSRASPALASSSCAGKMGHQVEERKISIDEWRDGVASGEITEVFACGTAAVVTPVGALKWHGGEVGGGPGHAETGRSRCRSAGAGRHPVRPRRGHLRLDAPRRLTPAGPRAHDL